MENIIVRSSRVSQRWVTIKEYRYRYTSAKTQIISIPIIGSTAFQMYSTDKSTFVVVDASLDDYGKQITRIIKSTFVSSPQSPIFFKNN